jgi:hypothetical protein
MRESETVSEGVRECESDMREGKGIDVSPVSRRNEDLP